jgi:tetratricopeptide (TPR) repeat protein
VLRVELVDLGRCELALAPADPWTYWARADMLLRLERPSEAWPLYERALLLDPDALFRALPVGAAPSGADGGGLSTAPEVAHAREAAAKYLHTHASDGAAWIVYAGASLALGDDAEAQRAADIALGLATPPRLAAVLRGIVQLRRKAWAAALPDLTSHEPLALAARALALAQLGRHDEARAALETLATGDAPEWQREWARARRALGN